MKSSPLLTLLAGVALASFGCGSDSDLNAAGQIPLLPTTSATSTASTPSNTTQNVATPLSLLQSGTAAATQNDVAQMVGVTLSLSNFLAPEATGAKAFTPAIDVDIAGDYAIKRTPLDGGQFRIEIRDKISGEQVAQLTTLPIRKVNGGYEQDVIFGRERSTFTSATQTIVGYELFFGFTGTGTLKYDALGVLQGVTYKDMQLLTTRNRTTTTGLPILPLNGTLSRNEQGLTGKLTYGDRGDFTLSSLMTTTGNAFGGLLLSSRLFEGQGRAFLNANFNAAGVYSPIPDPALSSPLVIEKPTAPPVSQVAPPTAPARAVSYTVNDRVFTVSYPDGTTRSFSLLQHNSLSGLEDIYQVPLAAGSRLILSTSEGAVLTAGNSSVVYVYAVGPDGRAIPFTGTFSLSATPAEVLAVADPHFPVVRAVSAGTGRIVYRDTRTGITGELEVTVRASAVGSGKGFVYIAGGNANPLIRYSFTPRNPATPAEPIRIETQHPAEEVTISRDGRVMILSNQDDTRQVVSINPADGQLTPLSANESGAITGLVQSELDPSLYYGNQAGQTNQLAEFRLDAQSNRLVFVRALRQGDSRAPVGLQVGVSQYLFTEASGTLRSIDVAAGNDRSAGPVPMGDELQDLAVSRTPAGVPYLHTLVWRPNGDPVSPAYLRTYPINADGTLQIQNSREIEVHAAARALAALGGVCYNGSASVPAINGISIPNVPEMLSYLAGQGYQGTGTPNHLTIVNNSLLFATNDGPTPTLDEFSIELDGSLRSVGSVILDGTPDDLDAVAYP